MAALLSGHFYFFCLFGSDTSAVKNPIFIINLIQPITEEVYLVKSMKYCTIIFFNHILI